jgi:RNA-directed DNA polymerase
MEGRRPTKENIEQTTASQTQSWINASSGVLGVREAAKQGRKTRFTALLHHVTVPLLLDSFYALKRDAAPGVDGVTWKEYETDLDKRLQDLHSRVHQGTYRAQASKRAFIPKRTDDNDPWALQPWRTRSSNTQWSRFSTRSMKRTSWGSLRGSVPGEASIKRWTRSG